MRDLCKKVRIAISLVTSFSFSGCAYKVGSELLESTQRLQAPRAGKLVVHLDQHPKAKHPLRCPQPSEDDLVKFTQHEDTFPTKLTCRRKGSEVIYQTKKAVPRGTYTYELTGPAKRLKRNYVGHYYMIYNNADFSSHGDHTVSGAKPITLNKKVSQSLHPQSGDSNDWYAVPVQGGNVRITSGFQSETAPQQATIELYRQYPGLKGNSYKFLANARVGEKAVWKLSKDAANYFIRVHSSPRYGEMAYWFNVSSASQKKSLLLQVVDLYEDNDDIITAVLSTAKVTQIKTATRVHLFRKATNKDQFYGTCLAETPSDGIVLCRMPKDGRHIVSGSYIGKIVATKR